MTAASAYRVSIDGGAAAAPSAVAVSGRAVTLTLATAVTTSTASVKVNYVVPGANPVQDAAGNKAVALTNRTAFLSGRSEMPGEDFTGSHHDMTSTPGLLLTSEDVTGKLTHPQDRSYGLTGDYYKLVREPGKKYRVQVWFGDNPTRNTGGGVELARYDNWTGTHSGFSPGSDHNREDGLTIIDVPFSVDRYTWYIKVTAYDMRNGSKSRTYSGPYRVHFDALSQPRQSKSWRTAIAVTFFGACETIVLSLS